MSEHDFKHVDVALERDVGVDAYQASRCRALIAATMLQAVRDIAPPRYRITDDEWLQTRQDALAWFADEGDEPFTVRWCCQQLDLDYEIVMTGVRFHEGELVKAASAVRAYVRSNGPHNDYAVEVIKTPRMPAWRIQADAAKLERGMKAALGK